MSTTKATPYSVVYIPGIKASDCNYKENLTGQEYRSAPSDEENKAKMREIFRDK